MYPSSINYFSMQLRIVDPEERCSHPVLDETSHVSKHRGYGNSHSSEVTTGKIMQLLLCNTSKGTAVKIYYYRVCIYVCVLACVCVCVHAHLCLLCLA